MFEGMKSATYDDALDAGYYAMRLLKHRARRPTSMEDLIVPGIESEPGPEAQAMAWQAILEIQAKEGKSIADLDQAVADRYTVELADILRTKRREAYPPDPDPARILRILEELRQTNIHYVR